MIKVSWWELWPHHPTVFGPGVMKAAFAQLLEKEFQDMIFSSLATLVQSTFLGTYNGESKTVHS